MAIDRSEHMCFLIRALQKDMPQYGHLLLPDSEFEQWQMLRSLMNVRPPMAVNDEFLRVQNELLQDMVLSRGVTDAMALEGASIDPRIALWQGDITTLRCDAIVNAANSALLGCFSPLHGCIDNIIHTMSGVQLRLECDRLMRAQGHEEPTGVAKLTPGYNLPAKYVLHTVGPIIFGPLTREDEALLASCYRSCLALAEQHNCQSIAFCCISTGVFRFPPARAAEIAVRETMNFLQGNSTLRRVVFNVFKDSDLDIYQRILHRKAQFQNH
ncbi:MAG: protein-ADP-ribose hydrolase [Clostridia bacterium]|nr:protein-ADP-ribose hydrolase [Clostridia bacterium]